MNKSIIKISLCAGLLASCGLKEDENSEYATKLHNVKIEDVQKFNFNDNYDAIIKEYERLKKEKEEELERQRLAEIERKKQEEAKRLAEQKRIEEAKRIEREKTKSKEVDNKSGWMDYQFTHYTAFCAEGCGGVTATGHDVSNTTYYQGYKIIAAPKDIPFYSIVRIQYPDGTTLDSIVLDRGGAIHGKLLDVLVSSEREARSLGRQNGKIKILRYGK